MNDNPVDFARARREQVRWLILRALDAARPVGTSELIIHSTVRDLVPDVTNHEVRNELDYLQERELITIDRNRPAWFSKLTRIGIDIVEYTIDCHPGIARPEKYW